MKKRILSIPGWFPDGLNPWNGDFIQSQTQLLRKENLQIDLCYADLNWRYLKKAQLFYNKKLRIDGEGNKDFIVSGPFYFKNQSFGLSLWLNAFSNHAIEMISKYGKPDLIHAHTYLGGAVASMIKHRYGIPYIVTEHSTRILSHSLPQHHVKVAKSAYLEANKVLAVSQKLAEAINIDYGISATVMPNFIDCELFKPSAARSDIFTFITISDLIPRKRVEMTIRAFAAISDRFEGRLIIVGDGKCKSTLQKLSSELGVQEKVQFKGQSTQTELATVLSQAHALIHASELETFGLVLIESMACGVPVICAENKGSSELINEVNGLYLRNCSVGLLAHAMLELSSNISKYEAGSIRSRVVNEMSAKSTAKNLEKIYAELS